MRRKNTILFLLLVVAIVLIGLTRYVLKKDTDETEKTQLEYYSNHLKLQKDFILSSYKQSAIIITEHLYRNAEIHKITQNVANASEQEAQMLQNQLNKFTHPIFNKMKEMGVSYINFEVAYPFFSVPHDSTFILAQTPNVTFSVYNNFIGYIYSFPFIINGFQIGSIEVGFDFHIIKRQISSVNDQTEIGYILIFNNEDRIQEVLKQNKFQKEDLLPGFLIDHEFKLPKELLNNKNSCSNLINNVTDVNNKFTSKEDFSIFLKTTTTNSPIALSMSKMNTDDHRYVVYLVSSTQNKLLNKVNEINTVIFIINILIILLSILGTGYLLINRLNILGQKQKIQLSEEKLKEINQSKDKFFSIIAHDLKNPFNGIMGMSGYLTAEYNNINDEEKKEIINDINISSKNAFNLLQNLLEWTRTQSGAIKNNPVNIIPKQIIDFSLETVNNLAKHKEIEIKQLIQTTKNGFADENLVATVIRNLCTNAIKFSPRQSVVEIVVKEFNKELIFCVKDKGIGLKSEEIDQLFRIDVNFHKKGTEQETGSGLGLKLCKEFVNYCNGRIWVVSDYGHGSSFFFTIPVYH